MDDDDTGDGAAVARPGAATPPQVPNSSTLQVPAVANSSTLLMPPPSMRDESFEGKRQHSTTLTAPSLERTREIFRAARAKIPEKRRMSKRRHYTASPFEKFTRYGRFPCKLVLNVLIFALMTALLLGCHVDITKSEDTQRRSLVDLFMPSGYLRPGVNYERYPTKHFGSISELRAFLRDTTQNYFYLQDNSTAYYQLPVEDGANATRDVQQTEIYRPMMVANVRVTSGRLSPRTERLRTFSRAMTPEDPYGVFGVISVSAKASLERQNNFFKACAPRVEAVGWSTTAQTQYYAPCRSKEIDNNIFDVVSSATVTMKLRSLDAIDILTETESTYDWEIVQHYSFMPNGLITLTLTARSTLHRKAETLTAWIGVSLALVVVLVWDLTLRIRALVRIAMIKRQRKAEAEALQRRLDEAASNESHVSTSSSSLSTQDDPERQRAEQANRWKINLRNSMGKSWTQWAIFVDTLALVFVCDQLLQCVAAYSAPWWLRYTMDSMVAVAIFGNCALFLSYLRFFPKLYVIMVASNVAVPHFLRFLVAVAPIYAAFAFFGVIVFGDYVPEFSTMGESVTALFCAIFGDSLLQMFQVTGATDTIVLQQVGWLYSAAFISFFIYAVLNIATAIILGAYTYVNETYSVHKDHEDRKVAPTKTVHEQLDEAVEQAQASLRRVAQLMTDDRFTAAVIPQVVPADAAAVPIREADDVGDGDGSGIGLMPLNSIPRAENPVVAYLDEQVHAFEAPDDMPPVPVVEIQSHSTLSGGASSSSGSKGARRRRKGHRHRPSHPGSPLAAAAAAPLQQRFFSDEWVDRDVIF